MKQFTGDVSSVTWIRPSLKPDSRMEVAHVGDQLLIRSTDNPNTVLVFTPGERDAFLAGARDGEFDLPED